MNPSNPEVLVARWTPEILGAAFRRVQSPHGLGITLRDPPFGRFEDRLDFRGLRLPPRGTYAIQGAWLSNADLSHAHLEHIRFYASRLTNCRFHQAVLRNIDLEGSTWLTRCEVVGAAVERCGAVPGAKLADCTFDRCSIRFVDATAARLEACRFLSCKLNSILLRRCDFDVELLRGHVRNLRLWADAAASPRSLTPRLSMSGVNIDGLGLQGGVRISGIHIQNTPLIPVADWPTVLPRVLAWASGLDPDDRSRILESADVLSAHHDQRDHLIGAGRLGRLAEPLRMLLGV